MDSPDIRTFELSIPLFLTNSLVYLEANTFLLCSSVSWAVVAFPDLIQPLAPCERRFE